MSDQTRRRERRQGGLYVGRTGTTHEGREIQGTGREDESEGLKVVKEGPDERGR